MITDRTKFDELMKACVLKAFPTPQSFLSWAETNDVNNLDKEALDMINQMWHNEFVKQNGVTP